MSREINKTVRSTEYGVIGCEIILPEDSEAGAWWQCNGADGAAVDLQDRRRPSSLAFASHRWSVSFWMELAVR